MSTTQLENRSAQDQLPVSREVFPEVCGALGCRNEENLRPVDHPSGGIRVLCPNHAADYRRRGSEMGPLTQAKSPAYRFMMGIADVNPRRYVPVNRESLLAINHQSNEPCTIACVGRLLDRYTSDKDVDRFHDNPTSTLTTPSRRRCLHEQ